jgi:hypothetical protein
MNFPFSYIRISSQFGKIQIAFLGAVEITSTCSAEKFSQIDFLNSLSSNFAWSPAKHSSNHVHNATCVFPYSHHTFSSKRVSAMK